MKFSCERDPILKEIANAYEIISTRNSLSILSNVLLEARDDHLLVRATDLKVNYESSIPVTVATPGSITVFCDKLHGILRSLPGGEVEFKQDDDFQLKISTRARNVRFQLKGIAAEKYPQFQTVDDSARFTFAQRDLIDMVAQTLFAVSDDETRYFMNGVYLEKQQGKLTMVATDGRRLAYCSKEVDGAIDDFTGVIIPPKALQILRRQAPKEGDFSLAVTEKNFHVSYDRQRMASSLIDAQFPNYQRVIPDEQAYRIVIDRTEFEEGLKRVSLLVEQKSRRVHLETQPDVMVIRSSEGEIGAAREEIPCEYSGPEQALALNYTYLLEPLREMRSDKVAVEFTDPSKSISLLPVPEADYFHVVMPMQTG